MEAKKWRMGAKTGMYKDPHKTVMATASVTGDGEGMGPERPQWRLPCFINKSKLWVDGKGAAWLVATGIISSLM